MFESKAEPYLFSSNSRYIIIGAPPCQTLSVALV